MGPTKTFMALKMLQCQKVVWTLSIIVVLLKDQLLLYMMSFDEVNPRSIPIMDKASIHHVHWIRELLDTAGCLLWFLPAYSPDINPIAEVQPCEMITEEHCSCLSIM